MASVSVYGTRGGGVEEGVLVCFICLLSCPDAFARWRNYWLGMWASVFVVGKYRGSSQTPVAIVRRGITAKSFRIG